MISWPSFRSAKTDLRGRCYADQYDEHAQRDRRNTGSDGASAGWFGGRACRCRPGAARKGPRLPDHHRARLFRPRGNLHQIRGRTDGRPAGCIARSVARLDLRCQSEARWRRGDCHFAIREKPGHRRHDRSCHQGRRRHRGAYQYAAFADCERLQLCHQYQRRTGTCRRGDQIVCQLDRRGPCAAV